MDRRKLGDLLVEVGCITAEQLQDALAVQRETKQKLGEVLIQKEYVTEEQIVQTLEFQLGIPHIEIAKYKIEPKVVKLIAKELARKYNVIPVRIEREKLVLAMSDPLNIFAIDDVKFITRMEVQPVISTSAEITKAIDDNYQDEKAKKAAIDLQNEFEKTDKADEVGDNEEVSNAPAVVLVNSIINQAITSGTSDIHIEPFEEYAKVRFRIDGELKEIMRIQKNAHTTVSTRIKIMANLNIAEKRIPQDGRIETNVDGTAVDLRVSLLPTVFGEKVVIRILNRNSVMVTIDKLGFIEDELKLVNEMLSRPYGIILVTGPTGSGKSTTLYAMLNEMNKPTRNIVTVEDPVEYMLDGINQVQTNAKAGLTFSSALRSILRQDPDIVMIGEMRDNETAEIAVKAAITGHVVLSTLHTNDAPSSITRLVDMGIEPFMVTTAIVGVMAQRLVRRICPKCKEAYVPNATDRKILGIDDPELMLYKGKGCPNCGGSGYKGRTGIHEIMIMEHPHRQAVERNCTTDELKKIAIENGMVTIKQSCIKLVAEGITTVDELLRVAYTQD